MRIVCDAELPRLRAEAGRAGARGHPSEPRQHLAGGGEAPYRVVDFDGGVEFAGTRDQCIDFVELAWWRAETAPSNPDYLRAAAKAVRLHLERGTGNGGGWQRDPYLAATIAGHHTL
jgi:hypothetical protein